MPRSSNQKLKQRYVAQILLEKTDDNNTLTANGIAEALATYDIPADRKSIYDDIEALRKLGLGRKAIPYTTPKVLPIRIIAS